MTLTAEDAKPNIEQKKNNSRNSKKKTNFGVVAKNNYTNDYNNRHGEEEEEENKVHEDFTCGIGRWRPKWLQRYATAKCFVITFSIVGVLQGAMFTYMIGIMSTIEKRFAFDTKVSGFILIADNLSQMIISPLVGYLGSKYNRSRLIGIGELVVAVSCLMNVIPYLMNGPGLHLIDGENFSMNESRNNFDLCVAKEAENCQTNGGHGDGGDQGQYSTVFSAVAILWFSCFANGFGYTAFYTIGLPYIDDNIAKKNSPMYLSTISTLRLLGPAFGFVLSSFSLRFYENPFINPGITNHDPRWIGAWWLGFVILGVAISIASIPMFMFPKSFKDLKSPNTNQAVIKFEGAKDAFRRVSTNYLLIFHVFGGVFRIIGYFGYYIIKPKYIELQYRQSASSASFYTGAASVVTMAIGTMIGGTVIRYMKPRARYLAIFICAAELFSATGILGAMLLKCETPHFASIIPGNAQGAGCEANCDCTTRVYQPICGSDGSTNYFSPCFAGCRKYDNFAKFDDCSCTGSGGSSSWATSGLCARDCDKFPYFISLLSMCNLIASTARTGDTLLTLRAVERRDKSFAMGLIGSIFAVFAFIPYPLIFGAIIDSTCLIWEKSCGKTGNCWLYDIDRFRVLFHASASAFIFLGIACEVGTVIMAGRIKNFYDEDEEDEREEGEKTHEDLNRMKPSPSPTENIILEYSSTEKRY